MKNKYIDLIEQTFEFPQDEFMVEDGELHFHDINMMDIINQYGTPVENNLSPEDILTDTEGEENVQRGYGKG